ncbi:alpha/beta fold hydrolase [Mangrovivirga cuniculi]|uniref:AB hydrolase-1 domain-containing protein n=1 Tax=Mangrovivirga cuniculi TaxID=2715131 RepID=A0A4D7KBG6_9BACT|nr:alpha/beta fold hydrolase [Mangrovivirga cuniculi]QCK16768.1 hypothetical protein DCC35_19545 [Mangrovivirga cuniculi]
MNKVKGSVFSEEDYLERDGYKLYYKNLGEGNPLLVLHGGPVLDHKYLIEPFSFLSKEFKLIFFDQCACGMSSIPPNDFKLDLNTLLLDIDEVLERIGEDSVNILGHSWGGFLGLNYTLNNPNRVKSLILSNSMPLSRQQWDQEQELLDQRILKSDLQKRNKILQSEQMRKRPSLAIKKLLKISFKPHFKDYDLIDQLTLDIPDDYLKRSELYESLMKEDLINYNLKEDAKKIKCPVLIIYGDTEASIEVKTESSIDSYFQHSYFKLIKNSGHFPFIENPSSYFTAVKKFLSKIAI